jgi:transcriptional regulator with XRE-family HTH domain
VTQQELGQRIADARRARRWTQGELAEALEVSVLDLLRAGQRPMLAIAARLGHFRDAGAVDRALRRAGTLIGLGELLESLLEAAPAGPASPRLGEAGRAGSGGLEPIAELLQRPDRDQLRAGAGRRGPRARRRRPRRR